jgi:hypothetical protein
MSADISVNYIEYDPFPGVVQSFTVSVSCRKPYTMRVKCNGSVVKTTTVCDGKNSDVVSFDIAVSQIHNRCVFEFLYKNKTVLTRTVRYKGGLFLYSQSVNEKPTAVIANTVIFPDDVGIRPVTIYNMVENIIAPVFTISSRVRIKLRSNDAKPATGSLCVSGRCIGLFADPLATKSYMFGINLSREHGMCEVFTTPEFDATNQLISIANKTNERVVKSLTYLPLITLGNCEVQRFYIGYGSSISVSYVNGSIITKTVDNAITVSGTGLVKLRVGIPVVHEINLFLYEQSVSISADYDLYVNVISCKQN